MHILYAGCNLFGQIQDSTEIAFDAFITRDFPQLKSLAIGHSIILEHTIDNCVVMHGHGLKPRETHVTTRLSPKGTNIKKATVSDTRVFLLDDSGDVYVLDFVDREVACKKRAGFITSGGRIVDIACGVGLKVARSGDGRLFNVPGEMEFKNDRIVQMCVGNEHCLLLDDGGSVYSFGRGSRGQLGHCTLENESEPKLIEALAGLKVVKISCGSWHSCALSAEGDVYLWGWNGDGQLGLFEEPEGVTDTERGEGDGDKVARSKNQPVSVLTCPTPLNFDDSCTIVGMSCGSRHTVFITDKNEVFGCGCNKFNQLGLKKREAVYKVTKIYDFKDSIEFCDVVCGPAATAILFSETQ